MSASVIWFIIGVVFMVIEMISPMFIIFFFALGAWAASISMYLGASLAMSFCAFSVVAVATLLLFRRLMVKTFKGSTASDSAMGQPIMHVGKKATVTREITLNNIGEITLGGSYWRAMLDAEAISSGVNLEVGRIVTISGHDPHDAILLQVHPS